MSYTALYRKFRPAEFEDVKGQDHIITTLKNQIKADRIGHAYLFCGTRGTGKTTVAKIFAKAVNCEHPVDGSPCGECTMCKNIAAGTSMNVIEIDAASNNGVDNIREIREEVSYRPTEGRYKVYIIDEVHMLSPSAWGALLKVMEEPPEYVKFILATTEVHKVPATIISRCQRYDFHRIRTADIAARLTYIAGEENLSLDPAAAQLIAHLSDGGMRDALSLLDQCASGGDAITAASVTAAAGVAGRDSVFAILEAVQAQDAAKALEITGALYDQSKDMVRLCDELLEQLRNMMLLKSGSGQPELLTCLPDEQQRLEELTRQPSLDTILRQIALLQDCRERMQRNPGKRVELEMALLQLAVPHLAAPVQTAPVQAAAPSAPQVQPAVPETPAAQPAESESPAAESKPLKASDFKPVGNWADILAAYQAVNPAVSGSLAESSAFVAGNTMLIVAKNRFFLTLLKSKENAVSLRETVKQFLGVEYNIRAKCSEPEQQASKAQNLVQKAMANHLDTAVENE